MTEKITQKKQGAMGLTRRSFQKWGSKGGEIGGAKNKKKGIEYFRKIGKLGGRPSKKYLKELSKIRKIME